MNSKIIQYNATIFPKLMSFNFEPTRGVSGCFIDLPRSVNQLYLSGLNPTANARELELFEKYANRLAFADADYEDVIDYIFIPVTRPSITLSRTSIPVDGIDEFFEQFGITLESDGEKHWFELIESHTMEVRADTWECILLDLLYSHWHDVIDCFDFKKSFIREADDAVELRINLGSYKFSADKSEQQLSNALRSAFFFTLAGYKFGLRRSQYICFEDYFDNEFYKRVSLVFSIWSNRRIPEDVRYIPLYDSFSNLSNENKTSLVNTLKVILDTDYMAFDDKETLKNHLIEGCNEIHTDPSAIMLEKTLIKPSMNYVILREKSKETMESAVQLYRDKHYKDCANRCFYAMTFALKALLEDQGMLNDWKSGELKEAETHNQLEVKLQSLVQAKVIAPQYENDFKYVKDARWGCDYSIVIFVEADANSCIQKMNNFCAEVERLTTH